MASQSPGQRRVRLQRVSSWWSAARAGKKQWCVAELDSSFCKGGRVQCSYFGSNSRSNHHWLVARLWKLLSLVSLWLATGNPCRWHRRAISQHSCRSMRQQHSAFAFHRSFAHGALRSSTKTTVACSTSWRCSGTVCLRAHRLCITTAGLARLGFSIQTSTLNSFPFSSGPPRHSLAPWAT